MVFGYIGLGHIGKPMCSTLVRNAGDTSVVAYDVVDEPVQEMVSEGARGAASARELAEQCDLIGVCVRNDDDVQQLLHDQEMFEAAKPGTIIAIHSTVTRDNTLRWAKEGAERGVHVLDAAITGGPARAATGELVTMVGGEVDAVERARRMFDATSKLVAHCGPVGSGIVTKLAVNLMNFQSYVAADEGVALVKAAGLEPDKLLEITRANGVLHPLVDQFITPREALGDKAPPFYAPATGLAEKDLGHALDLADELGVDISSTRQALANIRRAFVQE